MKKSIIVRPVTPEYVAAIQRNVDAHTPDKHPGLSNQEKGFGIPFKEFAALGFLRSAANGFEREHFVELHPGGSESASLIEAISILRKCEEQLDLELVSKFKSFNVAESLGSSEAA